MSGIVHTKASNMAIEKAREYGLRLTSGYRSPSHPLSKSNPKSDHIKGLAYDFAGTFSNMKKFAQWAHKSGMFKQVIFENKDYKTGRKIGGHMDHVHIAWVADGSGSGTIENGSEGGLVKVIQKLLGGITVDGVFGEQTEKAIEEFQGNHGLVVDGIVGKNTWNALTSGGGIFFS